MAKLDLKSAYRLVPVHPLDQILLGLCWENQVWLDSALPFGLRSAPKIFSAVADALAWAMALEGISAHLHYLDDFFLCWSSWSSFLSPGLTSSASSLQPPPLSCSAI